MNEEVSKILEMLQQGTITAEEAERLIRAAGATRAKSFAEDGPTAPPVLDATYAEPEARTRDDRAVEDFWDPFSPFVNPMVDLGDLSKALKRLRERVRRHNTRRFWWNYFRLNRWYEHRRAQRRVSMSTYERVRFVLLGAPRWSGFILQAQTDIHELLERDRIAWDLFRFGLEEEFGLEVSMEQARSFLTVQDVVDWVDSQRPDAPESSVSEEPAASEEPGASETPVEKPKGRAKSYSRPKDESAGDSPAE